MFGTLLLIGMAAARTSVPADTAGDGARRLVREARLAIEGDSAPVVTARWSAQLGSDSANGAALLGLATAARLSNDDPTAMGLYLLLLRSAERRGDGYADYARLGLARLAFDRTDMPVADSLARAALAGARARRDRIAEGEAHLAIADARMDEDAPVGRAYLDSARRALPAIATELLAEVGCRRVRLAFRSGAPLSPRELAAALGYARGVGARWAEAQCLRTTAIDLWTRGIEDSAEVLLRQSAELLRAVRDRRSLAFTLTTLADLYRDRGAYGEARAAAYESVALASASHYVSGEALATHVLGTLAYSLRDIPSAARQLDRAYALYGTLNDSADQMNVRSWQANIARDEGDLGRARRLTREVIAEARREHAVPWMVDLYQALADIEILAGDWPAAAAALDTAEGALRTHGIETWQGKLDYQRGRLALRRGNLDIAETIFRRYLRGLGSDDRLRQHETHAYLAEILARRGDLAAAEHELTAASDALDAWRATLDDQELRRFAFQATATDESDRNASVPRVLAALAEGGRTEAAFALAERRRARELGDRLLAASAFDPHLSGGARDGSSARPAAGAVTRATSAVGISRLLPDDATALVEYVTGAVGAPTTAFLLTRRGGAPRGYLLPPADSLAGPIGRFVALVSKGEVAAPEARALGAALLDPILRGLGPEVERLVIVPDGPLHRVPWDALRLVDGRWLVERYAVSLAPSAGALAVLWEHPRAAPPADSLRLLVMGDPDFGHVASQDAELFAAAGGLPPLPGSGAEARLVARYAPRAELRLGPDASAAYLRAAPLASFQVLHLATHALVDDRALGRTALALAPGGSGATDGGSGLVTPGELARLRLRADLVVLSACRTAGGVVVDGEGIQGLTAPLLEAGARSVVATSWRVGDRSTVRFVDGLYAALAKGRPVIEALRAAKLAAMRDGMPPSVWAAFEMVGDPATLVPVTPPRPRTAWWAGAGGLFVVAIAAALRRRSRRATLRSVTRASEAT